MNTLTPKQENFCRKYIETGNASEAYRLSYDAGKMQPQTINRNAKALLDNSKIATRLAELQAKHQKRHEVTVDSITKELDEARELALKIEQPSSAVSASMGKAKLHGLIVDKGDLTVRKKIADMTDEELAELAAEHERTRGVLPGGAGGTGEA